MRPTFGIITRHIAALQLRYSAILALGLAVCIWLFAMIDRLRRFDGLNLAQQLVQAGLPVLSAVLGMLPLLLGGATFIVAGILQRSGALVTLEASGRSPMRTAATFALNAMAIAALALALLSPMAAGAMRAVHTTAVVAQGDDLPERLRFSTKTGYVIVLPNAQSAVYSWQNVHVVEFDNSNVLLRRFDAAKASWQNNMLMLHGVRTQHFDASSSVEQSALVALATLAQHRDPARSGVETVSIWQLPTLIYNAQQSGFSAREALLAWHTQISSPILAGLSAALALLVVPRQRRGTSWIKAVLLLAFFVFWGYVCLTVAAAVASVGLLPIAAAVWGVRTVLAACLIMAVLRYNERF